MLPFNSFDLGKLTLVILFNIQILYLELFLWFNQFLTFDILGAKMRSGAITEGPEIIQQSQKEQDK